MSPSRSSTLRPRFRRAARPLATAAVLPALVLTLAACGGDSNNAAASASAGGQRPAGGRRFAQDPKVQACLKKEGVSLPSRPAGAPGGYRGGGPGAGGPGGYGGRGAGGVPPGGTGAPPPTSTNPPRPRAAQRDSAQFAKLQAALKKCGVNFPRGRFGGRPPGSGGTTTQPAPNTSTS